MINWLWVIPWVAIIIFYAGRHFGTRKERKRLNELEEARQLEIEHSKEFYDLKERVWRLENDSRGNYYRNRYAYKTYGDMKKEEHNNG